MRKSILQLALLITALGSSLNAFQEDHNAPKQPIAFNHKVHVTDGKQACSLCHAEIGSGELVDVPDVAKCMSCHSSIAPNTPAEQKLAALAKQNRDVDWVRVYQIPTFVRFSHRQHAQSGAKCETCHGPVETRVSLWKERELSMGECMTCHRENKASLECGSCHESR